ncbi:MAG: acetyltransferase [Gammaproteobacteria bacterium]|nr:acetyltransferase [Gammaproteobacteria bacterium]
MTQFDVFNGDGDGICALQQLRLAQPMESQRVTGVKRDIKLLSNLQAADGDQITVLDVSFDKNRDDVKRLLDAGARIQYFDHHFAGDIPDHPSLSTHIDTAAETCTSLLVNQYLQGQHAAWAVAGAYGDNLYASAESLASELDYSEAQRELLKELGTYLNYNGYGATLDDLYFHPDSLFQRVQPYADPFDFIEKDDAFQILKEGFASDMANARAVAPVIETNTHSLLVMSDSAWARRVSGVYANEQARSAPARAHALLNEMSDGTYRVSVRAPLDNRSGADVLCRAFPTGGGRQAAAGINELPQDMYDNFVEAFTQAFV